MRTPSSRPTNRPAAVVAVAAAAAILALTACGPAGDLGAGDTEPSNAAASTPAASPEPSPSGSPDPAPAAADPADEPAAAASGGDGAATTAGSSGTARTAAKAAPRTSSSAGDGAGGLPGTPVDWAASTGVEWGVVGVDRGDALNVRTRPGAGEPIVARLAPLTQGLEVTGRARDLGTAFWYELAYPRGWVHGRYVAPIAGTHDVTSQIVASHGHLAAITMQELAERVVAARGGRAVVSDGPHVGDLGTITVDLLDLYDDSVMAERLTIFGYDEFGHGFELRTVESTFFCHHNRAGSGGGGLVRVEVCT